MNFLSLVTFAEALCGPGALDAAREAGELVAAHVDRNEDRCTGADGGRLRAGGRPAAVALHSMPAPRSAFCLRRACRRAP
jgi:hypothetical protein